MHPAAYSRKLMRQRRRLLGRLALALGALLPLPTAEQAAAVAASACGAARFEVEARRLAGAAAGAFDGASLLAEHPAAPIVFSGLSLLRRGPGPTVVAPDALIAKLAAEAETVLEGQVKVSDSPDFVHYDADKPMASFKGTATATDGVEYLGNQTAGWLLGQLRAEGSVRYLYHSAGHGSALAEAAAGLLTLGRLRVAGRAEAAAVNVWVGGGNGGTASCHYDHSHNLFLQLHGRKRFLLLAPDLGLVRSCQP